MRRADYDRILATRSAARTGHFALHRAACEARASELSTGADRNWAEAVDNYVPCVGFVVPRRHARRAVTRNLIRRQMRQAVLRHRAALAASPGAEWVMRLRAPFDPRAFHSAASQHLKRSVRNELDALLASVAAGAVLR